MTTSVSQRINILSIKFKIMTELFLNNVTHPVIWEGWHFTHIWEKHNECIISLKGEALVHITSLTATFYWSDCTKPGERVVLYVCVRGIHFACFYNFPDCIFELIWQCGNSCFSFYCTKKATIKIYLITKIIIHHQKHKFVFNPYNTACGTFSTNNIRWRKIDYAFFPYCLFVCLMVFNATVNNISAISWQSVLLVEKPPICRKSLTNFIT
jgi:hypothetical protein